MAIERSEITHPNQMEMSDVGGMCSDLMTRIIYNDIKLIQAYWFN